MSKKKTITAICAAVMVCAVSVAGSLAYLTDKQDADKAVKNTFVAVTGIIDPEPTDPDTKIPEGKDLNKGFYLVETKVKLENGAYVLDETADKYVLENKYDKVVPNMEIKKDPKVTADIVEGVNAYVFVVVDNQTEGKLTYTIDDTNWEEVSDVNGISGTKKLYVYKGEKANDKVVTGAADKDLNGISILQGDKVTAADDLTGLDSEKTLSFSAYICQAAGFESAQAAYEACFPAA